MGVASHLKIQVEEYDARIRTFVPYYEQMLGLVAEQLVELPDAPVIVDLGTGTGALGAACLRARPDAELVGLDTDDAMLGMAQARLADWDAVTLRAADFTAAPLPGCHAIVACIALHHIRDADRKLEFYAHAAQSLRPRGVLLTADCFPSARPPLAHRQMLAWTRHLEASYGAQGARDFLAAWADEDTYFPLETELDWLEAAGLRPEVVWRADAFAVIAAHKPQE